MVLLNNVSTAALELSLGVISAVFVKELLNDNFNTSSHTTKLGLIVGFSGIGVASITHASYLLFKKV